MSCLQHHSQFGVIEGRNHGIRLLPFNRHPRERAHYWSLPLAGRPDRIIPIGNTVTDHGRKHDMSVLRYAPVEEGLARQTALRTGGSRVAGPVLQSEESS